LILSVTTRQIGQISGFFSSIRFNSKAVRPRLDSVEGDRVTLQLQ
jgi:hypothetical protein